MVTVFVVCNDIIIPVLFLIGPNIARLTTVIIENLLLINQATALDCIILDVFI